MTLTLTLNLSQLQAMARMGPFPCCRLVEDSVFMAYWQSENADYVLPDILCG